MSKAYMKVCDSLRVLALLSGALACQPSFAAGPVYCNQSFVAEAQSRCASESTGEPCTLISWEMFGQPARCLLVDNTLSWWVGVATNASVIDQNSGQSTPVYTWVPLARTAPAYTLAPLGIPKAPTDVKVR
jgi:hypothetical protein